MTDPSRFLCAEAARSRGDALAGTAPYGSVWILIEHRGGWPANGFDGLDLEPGVKARVYAAAAALRARMLLIRRHGRRTSTSPPRWAVLRQDGAGEHRQRWGTWQRDEDLVGIIDALDTPGEAGRPPVVLVCAHGMHDVCCAVRGRPVGRALSERWPELVWECSHVGGDRFAANVVVAPDGVYYGNLDGPAAVTAVGEHLADRIHADHLRGYTDLGPPQQAALAAVLRHAGPAGRYDYAIEETVREHDHDHDRWRIRVTGRLTGLSTFEVELRSHRAPPRRLTCRGPHPATSVSYEVTALRVG
ncbi:sucrase ferredoxin [Streptomyces solincola]|uniref:Sucrase ferredoxin n=1 Tax=Streptomyces solincola TaxID=2100817 RepID=A0A2S9PVL7_9ACTN|nr:sucrase ferredoxin [Streptomyces solincola]PRH78449.1 sucrase ferredoxin [Streptomyces solincola]